MAVGSRTTRGSSTRRPATRKGLTAKTFSGLNEKRMKSKGGGGNRVIIKQGDTVPVQFLGSPKTFVEFDQHQWREDGQWNYVPCVGDDCPLCDSEDTEQKKLHYKFLANVYNLKEKKAQVLEGPKTLATQIFYRYQRKPGLFLKRGFDITKFPTQPVTYGFALAEEAPVRTAGIKVEDLNEYIQNEVDRYFGEGGGASKAKSKTSGRSALDDDEDDDDFDDEDEFEDTDDGFEDDEDDDEDDEDTDDDPSEDEMLDKSAWPWADLKEYGRDLGLRKTYTKRPELVRAIIKKRGA